MRLYRIRSAGHAERKGRGGTEGRAGLEEDGGGCKAPAKSVYRGVFVAGRFSAPARAIYIFRELLSRNLIALTHRWILIRARLAFALLFSLSLAGIPAIIIRFVYDAALFIHHLLTPTRLVALISESLKIPLYRRHRGTSCAELCRRLRHTKLSVYDRACNTRMQRNIPFHC